MADKKNTALTPAGKLALGIWALVSVAGLVFTVADFISKPFLRLFSLAAIALYLLVGYYIFFGYKKPHGNLFRYTLLAYALVLGFMYNTPLTDVLVRGGIIIAAGLIAYMSGRLHKLQDCAGVLVAVEIILLAVSIRSAAFSPLEAAGIELVTPAKVALFDAPILWGSFAIAYLTRFTQHTGAGASAPSVKKAKPLPKVGKGGVAGQIVLSIVFALLSAAAIAVSGEKNLVTNVTAIVLYGIAVYYILWGYKIPHGDLFRYSLLVYAVLSGLMFNGAGVSPYLRAAVLVCTMLAAFMSGRLNKTYDCRVIIPVIAAIHTIVAVIGFILDAGTPILPRLLAFNHPILWGSFAVAYLARFEHHRSAGENEE